MSEVFYAEGLRFDCRRCSACCRGEPGHVFLTKPDLARLLKRLGLDYRSFFADYCIAVDTGLGMALSLKEKPGFDCVFWSEGGCTVYEDRPVQCSTYPFWSSILESRRRWNEEAASCPGVGVGELKSRTYIEERLLERRAVPIIIFGYGVDPSTTDPGCEA
jgi:Fe-S-cluster containining protein